MEDNFIYDKIDEWLLLSKLDYLTILIIFFLLTHSICYLFFSTDDINCVLFFYIKQ